MRLLIFVGCADVGIVGNAPTRLRQPIPHWASASAPRAELDYLFDTALSVPKPTPATAARCRMAQLLRLRGGSGRATAASRQKSKFLALKVGWKVDAHRRKAEQKMRDKLVAQASSAATKRDEEVQRMASELDTLQGTPFDPPLDPASLKAAEKRTRSLVAKYKPGQIVEIEDSEEWYRETEGDPSTKTHSITLHEDQSKFLCERAEAFARGSPEPRETCDEWDIMHPSGVLWGDEKVPTLDWDQDPAEIPGLLGDAAEMRGQEQWIGEAGVHEIEEAKAKAKSEASIDVEARARELYALLAREARASGCDLPQVGATWDLCFQVALRENAKAQEEALERLRVQEFVLKCLIYSELR